MSLLAATLALAHAASDSLPHYHRGRLTQYDIGPPNILLSTNDEQRLRAGKAVMQAVVADDGETRRMIAVQDIPVPASVALSRSTRRYLELPTPGVSHNP